MVTNQVLLQLEIMNEPDEDIDVKLAKLMIMKAELAILNRRHPFGYEEGTTVEPRYYDMWIEIVVYLYNRLGTEGQKYHKEAEVSRGYDEAYVPESMLRGVVPKGGMLI